MKTLLQITCILGITVCCVNSAILNYTNQYDGQPCTVPNAWALDGKDPCGIFYICKFLVEGALNGFYRRNTCSDNEYPSPLEPKCVEGDCIWGTGGIRTTTMKPSSTSTSTTTSTTTTSTTTTSTTTTSTTTTSTTTTSTTPTTTTHITTPITTPTTTTTTATTTTQSPTEPEPSTEGPTEPSTDDEICIKALEGIVGRYLFPCEDNCQKYWECKWRPYLHKFLILEHSCEREMIFKKEDQGCVPGTC